MRLSTQVVPARRPGGQRPAGNPTPNC